MYVLIINNASVILITFFKTIVEQAKTALKQATVDDNKLKDENDRLRQRQLLKEDEIKDLREKKLKLELEIKEKNQRERIVSQAHSERVNYVKEVCKLCIQITYLL